VIEKLPAKFEYYELFLSDQAEPASFRDACNDHKCDKWMEAMQEEMASLQANDTWDLVKLPPNQKPLKNKWVYQLKEEDGGKHC